MKLKHGTVKILTFAIIGKSSQTFDTVSKTSTKNVLPKIKQVVSSNLEKFNQTSKLHLLYTLVLK